MSTTMKPTEAGTAFLPSPTSGRADRICPLEQRDEAQRWIEESCATFIQREVLPKVEAIDHQEPGVMPSLVKKAGEQGLLMIDVPEVYGGAELGLLTSALVGSEMREASFSVAFGAHTTIGTLPIVFYGNEEQKQKYLPKLATGEWIAAYALTEPGVGSDAMGLSSRARLSEDGKYYILNGTKQWISNAGFADVMIAFARIANETYAAESEVFRTAANIEQARRSAGNDTEGAFRAIEEYAIEASIAKVHGSEVLAYVVDEGVQIFGGYGFMQEYPIEKAYRDARIQRIYEGTNEINRLVTSGTLFRRVMSGKLDLVSRIPAIEARVKSGQAPEIAGEDIPEELRGAVNAFERAKDVTLYAAMRVAMKYMQALEQEQEFIEYL